ncbi:15-hydroxyprostaglandin dehydrogenase [NAD(+)]-like [Ostrinia nubilalis]|uniref:15-hydroxyprostaglandin dehydrogenase [NAD(+)]-like n=1 Tax=Ostrinia nubilalis TaxID=29057 RepID=UPI003082455B
MSHSFGAFASVCRSQFGTMVYEVKGKVFLVTGAANGIGAWFVKYVSEEDPKHVAILDVNENLGVELQNELNSKYGANKAKFYKCDVTDEEQLFSIYKSVVDSQGGLDVVVNNAGIMNDSLQTYKKEIAINMTALVTSTLKGLELMRKDHGGRGGCIINISSIAALHPSPIFPIYFATKSAVLQFGNCLSDDIYYSRTGVRIISMCFGVTDTALYANLGSFDQDVAQAIPERVKAYPTQKVQTASRALVEAYKNGENGSIWLSTSEKPVKEITDVVKKAYGMLTELVFN